jgi:hypothetical protein
MSAPKQDKTIDDLPSAFLAEQEVRTGSGKVYDAVTRAGGTHRGTYGADDITAGRRRVAEANPCYVGQLDGPCMVTQGMADLPCHSAGPGHHQVSKNRRGYP